MKEQALEEFRRSEDFKEKLAATNHLAYRTGYEDGWDAIDRLYPDLDVTRVPLPNFDEEDGSTDDVSTNHVAPNEAILVEEVALI